LNQDEKSRATQMFHDESNSSSSLLRASSPDSGATSYPGSAVGNN
jgi:hypothetical protein